ncbi:MAG: RNA polymerase sigma factor SigJ [Alphaproteobacteria bacterium]|nr:RNA polymerase subunit sigma [Rhodobiaceae bacterium]MBO6543056.1 RNA polymerase sigma factor SigJ [Alphaproteobacteria bacterium]MBO6627017.1 RNA polymerase sigma factor SigJ [Alphaproteobacteria bacterium]MDF1626490.1 RNA polymerase sigma factor SigJ [Parvibaculaceae bacterium]
MNRNATDIFEAERRRLISLAYRMLGERGAAEDIVQNAWLRWQSVDQTTIETPAAWLTTVTTRLAIDSLKSARANREIYVGVWLPEPLITENPVDSPEDTLAQSQSVELALLWAMERLAPEERAAFILREAFDTDYADIADILGKTESACRKLIERARKRIEDKAPRYETPASDVRDLLNRFMMAVQAKDKTEILSLLSPTALALSDGGGKVRAALRPLTGAEEIANVFLSLAAKEREIDKLEWVEVNGQPALLSIGGNDTEMLVTLSADQTGRINWIYIMRNPDKLKDAVSFVTS